MVQNHNYKYRDLNHNQWNRILAWKHSDIFEWCNCNWENRNVNTYLIKNWPIFCFIGYTGVLCILLDKSSIRYAIALDHYLFYDCQYNLLLLFPHKSLWSFFIFFLSFVCCLSARFPGSVGDFNLLLTFQLPCQMFKSKTVFKISALTSSLLAIKSGKSYCGAYSSHLGLDHCCQVCMERMDAWRIQMIS